MEHRCIRIPPDPPVLRVRITKEWKCNPDAIEGAFSSYKRENKAFLKFKFVEAYTILMEQCKVELLPDKRLGYKLKLSGECSDVKESVQDLPVSERQRSYLKRRLFFEK
jgi:hypothetical protein